MPHRLSRTARRAAGPLRTLFIGPQILAFVPALTLAGYWYGGEALLFISALFLPAALGLLTLFGGGKAGVSQQGRDAATGLRMPAAVEDALDEAFAEAHESGRRSACVVVGIDDCDALARQIGDEAWDRLLKECGWRMREALRGGDVVARDGVGGFSIALAPVRNLDLESLIQLSARLQKALAGGFAVGGHRLHLTVSVGFCLPRRDEERSGTAARAAAHAALRAAQINGPASIRAHSGTIAAEATAPARGTGRNAEREVAEALEAGEIVAYFQPQISTDTGQVSGMEALARWLHPERGVIAPAAFLPMIEAAGLQRQLTDRMVDTAAAALTGWAEAGFEVPRVAVNFSHEDLSDPMLAERIRWALDRADIPPARLVVEVLETVISQGSDDAVTRTVTQLAELGCAIDLDDFGTGHAAIANIRRFRVGRIKIDRSLITRVDIDPDQQTMVAAILELAQRLGVDTLAEGVETVGEHAILAQLGCGHVQGYSIARPMPYADTATWLAERARSASGPFWPNRQVG